MATLNWKWGSRVSIIWRNLQQQETTKGEEDKNDQNIA